MRAQTPGAGARGARHRRARRPPGDGAEAAAAARGIGVTGSRGPARGGDGPLAAHTRGAGPGVGCIPGPLRLVLRGCRSRASSSWVSQPRAALSQSSCCCRSGRGRPASGLAAVRQSAQQVHKDQQAAIASRCLPFFVSSCRRGEREFYENDLSNGTEFTSRPSDPRRGCRRGGHVGRGGESGDVGGGPWGPRRREGSRVSRQLRRGIVEAVWSLRLHSLSTSRQPARC